jgi:hypothetical protein
MLQNRPTLIQLAAFHGSVNCFKRLLLLGAQLEEHEYQRHPTSHFAIAGDNLEIVRILEQRNVSFVGCLQMSVSYHRHRIFQWLFETLHPDVNDLDYANGPVIHAGIPFENVGALLFYLVHGLDINLRDQLGRTLLYMAASDELPDVVQILLNHVEINANQKAVRPSLFERCFFRLHRVSPLSIACKRGNIRVVELLLKHPGIDINFATKVCLSCRLIGLHCTVPLSMVIPKLCRCSLLRITSPSIARTRMV